MLFLAAFLAGLWGLSRFANAASEKGKVAPSGKLWPAGLDTKGVSTAVQFAATTERHPEALRAFAETIRPYDTHSAAILDAAASSLETHSSLTVSVQQAAPVSLTTSHLGSFTVSK